MNALSVIKAVIHARRGLLLILIATFAYSCCMVNSNGNDSSQVQKPSSSLQLMLERLRTAAEKTNDPCIVYTPDDSENEDSSFEFANRKAYGAQKYDRKAKKKNIYHTRKYGTGASHHSHTQKKKVHGKGKKSCLSPQNALSKAQQDVQQLITQQSWEDDFEARTYIAALERLQKISQTEEFQEADDPLWQIKYLMSDATMLFGFFRPPLQDPLSYYYGYIAKTLDHLENLPLPQFIGATAKHLRYIAGKLIIHIPHDNRAEIETFFITE